VKQVKPWQASPAPTAFPDYSLARQAFEIPSFFTQLYYHALPDATATRPTFPPERQNAATSGKRHHYVIIVAAR